MADTLEVRMARLEGAYEQINVRLGAIERRLDSLESRMETRFTGLEGRFTGLEGRFTGLEGRFEYKFNWLIGMMLTSWITLMLAILLHR